MTRPPAAAGRRAGNFAPKPQAEASQSLDNVRKVAVGAAVTLVAGLLGYNAVNNTGCGKTNDDITYEGIIEREPTEAEQFLHDVLESAAITGGSPFRLAVVADDQMPKSSEGTIDGLVLEESLRNKAAVMLISETMCGVLVDYAGDPSKPEPTYDDARAINTLAHEGAHVRTENLSDEALINCYAFQELPKVAIALGATPDSADLVQQMQVQVYANQPARYRTLDCHDGGPYDLQPATQDLFPYASPE